VAKLSEYEPEEAAERLYGAVAEDEGLRGDLDDTGYAPLVAWAAERADALAAEPIDDVDGLAERLRDAVAHLVAASESGDAEQLAAIASDIVPVPDRERLQALLAEAPEDPNARAAVLATALHDSDDAPGTTLANAPIAPLEPSV
jgi:hypothetical protein